MKVDYKLGKKLKVM